MKKGDKVVFLSETGGGIVSGFQSNNIVLVEDEDGFEIPMRISEVVVVGEESYDRKPVLPPIKKQPKTEQKIVENKRYEEHKVSHTANTNNYYNEDAGEALFAYLAFVPEDEQGMMATKYATFFINDCNYHLHATLHTKEGNACTFWKSIDVQPNTKIYIDELEKSSLNSFSRIIIQIVSYKEDKPFMRKAPLDIEMRIDGKKFFMASTFSENDFFDDAAYIIPVVENDKSKTDITIDATKLQKGMLEKTNSDNNTAPKKLKTEKDDGTIVIDLHANELLDTTAGMQPDEILKYQVDYFHNIMKQYSKKNGQKIVFIHGKGEGVLRQAIVHALSYRYKRCKYQDASFQEYGFGATQVTIR